MGKIIYLCGKSSSGKDTVFKELMKMKSLNLYTIVPYTTRPIRSGEQEGKEYFFTDEAGFQKLLQEGKVIEHREYHTVMGLWRYFTVDDGRIDLKNHNYLAIGTLVSFEKMCNYFGRENFLPILIEVEDGVRLQRALNRELKSRHPAYQEMCRRFLTDSEDFSQEKIIAAGITRSFVNDDLSRCLGEIETYILENCKCSNIQMQ